MTVTIAVSDEEMRAFLAEDPNNDVVMWVPGDQPLGRFIDLLVLPYKTTFDELSELDPSAVDTDALTERVLAGNLRAALDVTDPEPLPPHHPLWKAPGVTITPHVGGNVESMASRMNPLIVRQIAHLAAGEAPDHIVFGPGAEATV